MWLPDGTVRKLCRRYNEVGHAHELTFSCFRKLPLLGRDLTRNWLIEAMQQARQAHQFELWSFVAMPDHVHAILLPNRPDYSISRILGSIKQPVSRKATNHLRKHAPDWLAHLEVIDRDGQVGHHFWQPGGGYDRNITDVSTLWEMIDYIHLNPVRRGLVAKATDWPWSSARQYAGFPDAPLIADEPPTH